jgi:signal transduction histidine kinase
VVVVESHAGTADTLAAVLRLDGYHVMVADNPRRSGASGPDGAVDVVLAELRADDPGAKRLLDELRRRAPEASIIVLTSYATLESALRALRSGAEDYLTRPVDADELRLAVAAAMRRRRLERELAARVRELEQAHAELQATHDELRALNADLQQRVDAATAQLHQQVEALDAANQQLVAAQEQHHTFVAMVAHEMRGPIGPIMNYALLAKRPAVTPEKRNEYMDIIVEHAHRMNRLVGDLQTATRLSTGQFALEQQRCDVAASVGALVEEFRSSFRDREFSLERPEAPVEAEVDGDRVAQAVRNLIENAIKYSVEAGAIELAVWKDDERVYIRVGDYGAGIPEAERERIFQPFTRLERRPESKGAQGTGLGLYITRGIVAEHGGALTVVNRVDDERAHGAIFTMALPLRAEMSAEG